MKHRFSLILTAVVIALATQASAVTVLQHSHSHVNSTGATVSCTLNPTGANNIIVGMLSGGANGSDSALVTSVIDNRSNTYVAAPGAQNQSVGLTQAAGFHGIDVWHALGATSGVTTITVTFSTPGVLNFYKACFAYEVSGSLTFDAAANITAVSPGNCVAFVCTGAPVNTSTSAGFVLGLLSIGGWVLLNPLPGNEFTSGGELQEDITPGIGAAASLISSSAGVHTPVWPNTARINIFIATSVSYKQ